MSMMSMNHNLWTKAHEWFVIYSNQSNVIIVQSWKHVFKELTIIVFGWKYVLDSKTENISFYHWHIQWYVLFIFLDQIYQ